jgi:hypothetical protein
MQGLRLQRGCAIFKRKYWKTGNDRKVKNGNKKIC